MKKEPRVLPVIALSAFLLLGISLILWPNAVISVFPPLIGVVLMAVGALGVAQSLALHRRMMEPGFRLVGSIVNIVVGFVFVLKQDLSLAFLTILFGLYVLVSAAIEFTQMLQNRREKKPWVGSLLESCLEFVLGFILLLGPFSERNLWVRLLGVYFVISGSVMLQWVVALKEVPPTGEADAPDEEEAPPPPAPGA